MGSKRLITPQITVAGRLKRRGQKHCWMWRMGVVSGYDRRGFGGMLEVEPSDVATGVWQVTKTGRGYVILPGRTLVQQRGEMWGSWGGMWAQVRGLHKWLTQTEAC